VGVPLRVVAAAVLCRDKVLLVSKHAAPDVFFLPGGKPEAGEEPLTTLARELGEEPLMTLARELGEELDVTLVDTEPFGVVCDEAALEGLQMEMHVYLARVDGALSPRSEIADVAWVGADGASPGTLAPAIRNHVLPRLAARRLIS
jgi:8-oxo-dGTP diphosphatase